jgi:GTPase SAR1 family protein
MLHKKIIILGPPCVGKTTLIICALKNKIPSFSTHGARSIVQLKSIAKSILNLDMSLFFDAGGIDIYSLNHQYKDNGFDMRTVLLLPPKDVYLERERIEIEKGEHRNQDGLTQYNIFKEQKSEFDLVIEDVLSPQEIFDYIKKWENDEDNT